MLLRDIKSADLEMLRAHRNRPDTRCWLGDAREVTEEQQKNWYRMSLGYGHQIASIAEEDIGLARVSTDGCVGADVFAPYRGRGLGHKVFEAACAAANTKSLWLRVFIENEAAVKIYVKAGFIFDPDSSVEIRCRTLPGRQTPSLLHYVTMKRTG